MKLVIGENPKCTNEEYHSDREYLSSSAMKLLYVGADLYRKKYFAETESKKSNSSFEFGNLIHSLILEPENIHSEYAFYPGKVRSGNKFKEFQKNNKGKKILTISTLKKAKTLVRKYKRRQSYKKLFFGGRAEITACAEIEGIKCKARFDYINIERGRIIDIKTTRFKKSEYGLFNDHSVKLKYSLSAALYTMIAEIVYGRKFEFAILALSKKDGSHFYHVYKFDPQAIKLGRRQISIALENYKNDFLKSAV